MRHGEVCGFKIDESTAFLSDKYISLINIFLESSFFSSIPQLFFLPLSPPSISPLSA